MTDGTPERAPAAASSPVPDLAIDRRASVQRIQLDAGSWVDLVTGFVRDPAGALAEAHEHVGEGRAPARCARERPVKHKGAQLRRGREVERREL